MWTGSSLFSGGAFNTSLQHRSLANVLAFGSRDRLILAPHCCSVVFLREFIHLNTLCWFPNTIAFVSWSSRYHGLINPFPMLTWLPSAQCCTLLVLQALPHCLEELANIGSFELLPISFGHWTRASESRKIETLLVIRSSRMAQRGSFY